MAAKLKLAALILFIALALYSAVVGAIDLYTGYRYSFSVMLGCLIFAAFPAWWSYRILVKFSPQMKRGKKIWSYVGTVFIYFFIFLGLASQIEPLLPGAKRSYCERRLEKKWISHGVGISSLSLTSYNLQFFDFNGQKGYSTLPVAKSVYTKAHESFDMFRIEFVTYLWGSFRYLSIDPILGERITSDLRKSCFLTEN